MLSLYWLIALYPLISIEGRLILYGVPRRRRTTRISEWGHEKHSALICAISRRASKATETFCYSNVLIGGVRSTDEKKACPDIFSWCLWQLYTHVVLQCYRVSEFRQSLQLWNSLRQDPRGVTSDKLLWQPWSWQHPPLMPSVDSILRLLETVSFSYWFCRHNTVRWIPRESYRDNFTLPGNMYLNHLAI